MEKSTGHNVFWEHFIEQDQWKKLHISNVDKPSFCKKKIYIKA